jgi:hypothetical protein
MNLIPPGTPKVYVFILFCITWAASVRRLKSLPKSNIMLLTMKNVTQHVIFARQMLKTKLLMENRLGLHIFVKFLALKTISL